MHHKAKLSKQNIQDALILRRCGWPVKRIADEFGVTSTAINYWLLTHRCTPWTAEYLVTHITAWKTPNTRTQVAKDAWNDTIREAA